MERQGDRGGGAGKVLKGQVLSDGFRGRDLAFYRVAIVYFNRVKAWSRRS